MGRNKSIRITKNDRAEYKRLVSNAKSKIRRTNKNYGVDLSDEIELPKIGEFKTRKEYNEWKDEIHSFTSRGNLNYQFVKNDYGVVASKKKIKEIEKLTKQAQENAQKQVEQYIDKPYTAQGKKQGTVGQAMLQMGRPEIGGISVPKDFDFSKIRSADRLEQIERGMTNRANPEYYDRRMNTMRENYIDMLSKTFNSDADELISAIKSMPVDDFYEMYLTEKEFNFDYFYTEEGTAKVLNQLMSFVEQYNQGKLNPMFNFRIK